MNKGLKIALAASVALNIFAVVGGGTAWVLSRKVAEQAAEGRRPGRSEPVWAVVEGLPPAVRDQVKEELRANALQARPDFEEARAARREAIAITASDSFDAVAVAALLERSRASEMRGRSRLESGAVETLGRLSVENRKALAPILSRHRSRSHDSKKPDAKEKAAAQGQVAQSEAAQSQAAQSQAAQGQAAR